VQVYDTMQVYRAGISCKENATIYLHVPDPPFREELDLNPLTLNRPKNNQALRAHLPDVHSHAHHRASVAVREEGVIAALAWDRLGVPEGIVLLYMPGIVVAVRVPKIAQHHVHAATLGQRGAVGSEDCVEGNSMHELHVDAQCSQMRSLHNDRKV
jgi:hypothetical protein